MKKILIFIVIVALGFFLLTRNESDDEFFTSYFNDMVDAGESKDLEQFMDFFSLQYKDENGFNYLVIKNIVKNTFEGFDSLEGSFSGLSSKIENSNGRNLAVINLDVSAVGIKNGIDTGVLGLDNSPENITVHLEKSTLGKWKIVEVRGVKGSEF